MSDDLYCRRCIDRGKALARKDAALRMVVEALEKAHATLDAAMGDGDCYIVKGFESEHANGCPFCSINAALAACREARGETP